MRTNEKSIRYDVFASHNGKDKNTTRAIVSQMRNLGLRVFFDEDSIAPGENIVSALETAIMASQYVVLFISNDSMKSPWVAMEISSTAYSDPGNANGSLIPVYLEPVDISQIRLLVRQLNHINLYNFQSAKRDYHRLLRRLGVTDKTLPAPPPNEPMPPHTSQDNPWSKPAKPVILSLISIFVLATITWFYTRPTFIPVSEVDSVPEQSKKFIVSGASTDFSSPTPLPSRNLHGFGTRKFESYYFMFLAGPGLIEIEAIAHNDKTGSAVNVIVTDLDNNKRFAAIHFGFTNQPKTLRTQFVYGRQSKMLLRLDTDDSTVEYRIRLSGAVKLPGEQVISRLPVVLPNPDREYLVENASTDLNNPSSLPAKYLHGYGIRERITYYFKFFAGPGDIEIAATAHNDRTGSALNVTVSDLDNNKKFAAIHFGFSGSPKTLRENFTYGSQGPLLLQLTLDDSSVEYWVQLSGAVKLPP